jgi:hypothetical protein
MSLTVPRRVPGVVERPLGDEIVAYEPAQGTAHVLRGHAAGVWRRCDGDSDVPSIAIANGLSIDDVVAAVAELEAAGLLIAVPGGLDRRKLLQRGVLLGGAVAGAMSIESILAAVAATRRERSSAEPAATPRRSRGRSRSPPTRARAAPW